MKDNNINNEIDNIEDLSSKINDTSMLDENGKPPQVNAKTSMGNKAYFSYIVDGESNHEKIVSLRKAYEEKLAREKSLAFVDNIDVITKCLKTIETQVKAVGSGLLAEEERIKRDYIWSIGEKLSDMEESLGELEELNKSLDRLNVEKQELEIKLEGKQKDIIDLDDHIFKLESEVNELNAENNLLLREKSLFDKTLKEKEDNLKLLIINNENLILDLKDDRSSLQAQIIQLEKTEKNLNAQLVEMRQSHSKEIEEMYKANADNERILNEKINALSLSNSKFEADKKEAERYSLELQGESEHLTRELNEFKEENKELLKDKNKLDVEVEKLRAETSINSKEVTRKNMEIVTITTQNETYIKSLIKQHDSKVESFNVEVSELKKQFNEDVSELKKQLSSANKELETERSSRIEKEKDLFMLKIELDNLKEKYDMLNANVEANNTTKDGK